METSSIYKDIATRCGGNIYIGVAGPVRCGKSTFIKKFMEEAVIPQIADEYDKKRAVDELPQSAGGKTVMTTEPKFIPDDGVGISFGNNSEIKIKMIDCVGYMIPDALGNEENGNVRMVKTPWSKEPMPFDEAAELGTQKVIYDHSTVGILLTCDGTIGDIPRASYVEAEEKIARQLKEIGKPFITVLNSACPDSNEAIELALQIETKYNTPVALVNCLELNIEDINHILNMLILEFPVKELSFQLPAWVTAIRPTHKLISCITSTIKEWAPSIKTLGRAGEIAEKIKDTISDKLGELYGLCECRIKINKTDVSNGKITLQLYLPDKIYYDTICEITGLQISSQSELIKNLTNLAESKKELDKYEKAIADLEENGYGIVLPEIDELTLEEPQIIRQAGSYGVKLKASASSVHMIRANIETEINPIVGTEEQSEELIKYLNEEFGDDPKKIWDSNIFGKSLYEMMNDGLHTKLAHLSDESKEKLSETLSRVINEGSGGLICIIL